mmetsp:Transcript_91440/g.209550  ORF Transcript_91440/g.209550 Transcript_91440/m.209550 type:complete len:482 (+) Transcript_91440:1241-2686(+)
MHDDEHQPPVLVGHRVRDTVVGTSSSPWVSHGNTPFLVRSLTDALRGFKQILLKDLGLGLIHLPGQVPHHVPGVQAPGFGHSVEVLRQPGGLGSVAGDDEHWGALSPLEGFVAGRKPLAVFVVLNENPAAVRCVERRILTRGQEPRHLEEFGLVNGGQKATFRVVPDRPRQPNDALVFLEGVGSIHNEQPLIVDDPVCVPVHVVLQLQSQGPGPFADPPLDDADVPLPRRVHCVVLVQDPLLRFLLCSGKTARHLHLRLRCCHGLQLGPLLAPEQGIPESGGKPGKVVIFIHEWDTGSLVNHQGVDLIQDQDPTLERLVKIGASLLGQVGVEGLHVLSLDIHDIPLRVHPRTDVFVLGISVGLLAGGDAELGLDGLPVLGFELGKQVPVGQKISFHEVLVVHHDVHLLAQLGATVQGQAGDDCGLPLSCPHLGNQSSTVWDLVSDNEFQAHEHADHLGMVRQHQQIKGLLHQLRPPEKKSA